MRMLYRGFIFLDTYRALIIATMFLMALVGGFALYCCYYDLSVVRALRYTVLLFIDAIPNPIIEGEEREIIPLLEIASIVAKSTLFLTVFIWFFKSQLASIYQYLIVNEGKHVLVIGLDSNSRFFINSELEKGNNNIVVVENDEFNPYIDVYKNRAISVLTGEIESVMEKIGIDSAKYIFVSTGDSKENISTTLKIIEYAQENPNKKLLVHIEDRTLRSLYNDESLLGKNKLNIQPFSFHKESAKILFEKHDIDGDGIEIISSYRDFEIAVVGASNLAIEVIVEAIKMSHLPNQNRLIINCVDKDIKAFRQRIEYEIPYIEEVKHIKLNYIKLDPMDVSFYLHALWGKSTLKHIILSHPKSVTNVNIATKLKRLAYQNCMDNFSGKIHIATYSDVSISNEIRSYNRGKSNNIYIFASADVVCASENLIDTDIEKKAKLIHHSYHSTLYNPSSLVSSCNIMDDAWESKDFSINDKRSSIAQAKHIKVKLKSLGLKMQKSETDIETLLESNQSVFNEKLQEDREHLHLNDKLIEQLSQELKKCYEKKTYSSLFFPQRYGTLFEKILRAEHNRWIAMLIMMDNHYDPKAKEMEKKERKIRKIHHLLKPFDEFEEDEKVYIVNDIFSLLYIPQYLACVGYEIVAFEV